MEADGYTMFICGTKTDVEEGDPIRARLLRMETSGQVTWYKEFDKSRRYAKDIGSNMCRGVAF